MFVDLGSGALVPLTGEGLTEEPTVPAIVAAGADVVAFSGDKLLGGPQAGIIVGRAELIARIKKHPLTRALRIDKMTVAALEATLELYRDGRPEAVPTYRMLTWPVEELSVRAERLHGLLVMKGVKARVAPISGQVGGGAMPLARLPSYACILTVGEPAAFLECLRGARVPVIGRISDGEVVMDVRCLAEEDLVPVADAVGTASQGRHAMLNSAVLVLNRNYQPVHVTSVKRALSLLYLGVAKAIDTQYRLYEFEDWAALSASAPHDSINTIDRRIRVPRVVVLSAYEYLPKGRVRFSRLNIYARDHDTCQYCARQLAALGAEPGPCRPSLPGRQDELGERGVLVRALQPAQGRAHAGAGGHEAAQGARAAPLDALVPRRLPPHHLPRVAAVPEPRRRLVLERRAARRLALPLRGWSFPGRL